MCDVVGKLMYTYSLQGVELQWVWLAGIVCDLELAQAQFERL